MTRLSASWLTPSSTFIWILRQRAETEGQREAYVFLAGSEVESQSRTWSELDLDARVVGSELQRLGAQAERCLLLYPPGLEFIGAFLGCFYAGAVAVPAYPPRPNRVQPRLRAIVRDARPRFVLTTSALARRAETITAKNPELRDLEWRATDALDAGLAEDWREPSPGAGSTAFLQYTSGSTATPKGVRVSHGNLLHNEEMMRRAFAVSKDSVILGWLPLYHDMGLVGNVLQPLYSGARCVLMPPMAFLHQPVRWLRAISRYRATISGGPDFAYEACVRQVSPEDLEGLDLHSWSVAFNGAEPVRAATLESFSRRFAPAGFRREAFYPCYGLAEATLFVAGGDRAGVPTTREVEVRDLEQRRVGPPPPEGAPSRRLVSCGRPWMDQEVVIADPRTGRRCPANVIGEIRVSGPSVAHGYWGRSRQTAEVFETSSRQSGGGQWLRTGDLGFVEGGELFVTGRIKDLIIIRGRNHYPQDVERSATESHAALRPGTAAAFSVDLEGAEKLVVVCEVRRKKRGVIEELSRAVRRAVSREHGIEVHELVLVRTGTIPRTSSGKIQRRLCRSRYLAGELRIVDRDLARSRDGELAVARDAFAAGELFTLDEKQRLPALLEHLGRLARVVLGGAAGELRPEDSLADLGLDSLALMRFANEVETSLRVTLSLPSLLEGPSLGELAATCLELLEQGVESEEVVPSRGTASDPPLAGDSLPTGDHPLSSGQRALWFLERLAPESASYNLVGAVEVRGGLDLRLFRHCLQVLADRHPALRTTFHEVGGEVVQRVAERGEIDFVEVDGSSCAADRLRDELLEQAYRPFDLGRGPLMRVVVFHRPGGRRVMLWALHHIIADFWSCAVLLEELGSLHAAAASGSAPSLPPLPVAYTDWARSESRLTAGERGESSWSYWRAHLEGAPLVLELPTDRARPPVRTEEARAVEFRLGAALTGRLRAVARAHRATLFMTLLAGFGTLLGRYCRRRVLLVGSPSAGRPSAGLAHLVGYFVNPVVLRGDLGGDPPFERLIERVRGTTLAAFEHADFPFPLLVERLHPERDPNCSPIFQVMFAFDSSALGSPPGLASFALGEGGARVSLGSLQLESRALEERRSEFDLSLRIAELEEGLGASLVYAKELFDRSTVARLAAHFEVLLAEAGERPWRSIDSLPVLSAAERQQTLIEWNSREECAARPAGVRELFSALGRARPEAVAAVLGDAQLSFGELARRSAGGAAELRRRGAGRGRLVGLYLDASFELLVGIFAILESGSGVVPLDPEYPVERLLLMAAASGLEVLVTGRAQLEEAVKLARRSPSRVEVVCLDETAERRARSATSDGCDPFPGDPVYLIFTSGSTGVPKGVPISHRNLGPLLRWSRQCLDLDEGTRVLQCLSPGFDFGLFEILTTVLFGGRLYLLDRARRGDVAHFLRSIERGAINTLHTTPSFFRALAAADVGELWGLRLLHLGGEALTDSLVARAFDQTSPDCRVFNGYGPTEATINCAIFRLERRPWEAGFRETTVPIGRPTADHRLLVLDRGQRPLPIGVAGELCVTGAGLSQGYLNLPALTAGRFLPETHTGELGGRLYRTGDLVRWRREAHLEFLGRFDDQVKIRGFRIELGEVEAALSRSPGVRECAVLLREDVSGLPRLVAFVAGRIAKPAGRTLRADLSRRLPGHMVPSAFVELESLPATPNDKVDRAALVGLALPAAGPTYAAPRTAVELGLASIFSDLLGRDRVGVEDGFFHLGGHSLLATRLVTRIREDFGVELPLRRVFEGPTVAQLAQAITAGAEGSESPSPAPSPGSTEPPLSFSQERLWFLDQLEPGSVAYNIPAALGLEGALIVPALRAALGEVVRRQESLRTRFEAGSAGRPVQRVMAPRPIALPVVDLGRLKEPGRQKERRRLMAEEARKPFDLRRGPLVRWTLVRHSATEHHFLVTLHHIVADGWSIGVLIREVVEGYRAFSEGARPRLPELPLQYADFAVWQRKWLSGDVLERQLSYWRKRLAGMPAVLDLPLDRPRPARRLGRGTISELRLADGLRRELEEVGRERGATLFMILMAAFQLALSRLSRQRDFGVGLPIANRRWAEVEGLVGFFANTVVLRPDLGTGGSRFEEILLRVREAALQAYAHQDLPFEALVEALAPERRLNHTPLFQVMLADQDTVCESVELPGLEARPRTLESGAVKFDLTLNFRTSADGVTLGLEYDRDLFDGSTAQRLLRSVRSLLGGIAEDPGRRADTLLLFGSAERHQLLREWNDTEREDPGAGGLERLFDAQVERTPEAVAVDSEDRQLSYRELRRRAARVARRLRGLGVGPDCRVGLCLERSTELVVGMVGILRAGGAYVPLDPSYPAARLAFMVQDAKAPVLVTSRAQLAGLPRDGARVVSLDEEPASGSGDAPGVVVAGCAAAAYVLYTSGSTGRPKGVVISRGALANHMRWMQEDLPLAAGDRVLQKTPFSFDASVWEFWAPLLAGARLVMASPGGHQDSRYLVEVIREKGITVLQGVPLLLRALLEHPTFRHCRTLRRVFSGGEPLTADLRDRFAAAGPEVPLFNLYGPTETTVQCSYERCGAGGVLRDAPLGRPIHNVRLHVLSRGSSPAAAGGIGELHVGGGGVGRGYLRRPALTAERFVPDPLSGVAGARLYRTADLARWLSDGRLEFLRRIDGQVKVRGFRIELGEVEAVLASCAGVRACAVAVREDQPGIRRLVAYVEAGGEVSTAHLREQLKERLPDYMVPSALERVEALPATPSCKLDRKALLAPEWAPAPGDQRPATLVEQVLAGLWSDLLGVEGVEPEDDFFGLGGHSLLAGRLTARIADVLKVRLPLGTVFEAPTVAALAARVADARGAPLPSIRPVPRRGDLPLSFGQERLWFVHQLRPSSAAYNIAAALRIDGNLVESALELSLRAVVERHESLRTVFPSIGDRPVQRLLEEPFALSRVDLKGLPEAVRDRELGCQVHSAARRPFDLTRGPLLRCSLLGVSEGRWVLVVVLHHIVGDAWSMDVLTREVTALYTAFVEGPSELAAPGIRRDGILSALPIQYADLASWQREHLGPEALAPGIAYWRDRLEGAPEVMRLPIDGPSPTLSSPASGREGLVLESAVCEELRRLGREEGATLFMALLAAFQAQLFFYTKQPDVVVGTPAAMRHRSELEGLIGFLVNTLVLRTDLSGDPSFRELLVRVRDGVVAAYDHQDVPFEYLVQILRPQRSASRSPLYQVWFVLHEAPSKGLELPGVAVTPLGTDVAEARHDLQLDLTRSEAEIEGALIYRRNLFRQETVSRMAREFSALVSGIVARPDARLSQLEDALRAAEQRWQHAAKSRFSQLRRRELSGLKGLRRRQVAGPPQG